YHFANVEKPSDYALLAHRAGAVLVFDIGDRENIRTVGIIRLPGPAAHLSIDRERRLLYVSAYDRLYLVDFDLPPTTELLDANEDGIDDRVLETIELGGSTNSPILLAPELGLAYAAGLERGLTSLATGGPGLVAVTKGSDGFDQPVSRLAPFGVPIEPVVGEPPAENLSGSFQIKAALPGELGAEVLLDVLSLGPGGRAIPGAGDSDSEVGLPRVALSGERGVPLRRLADNPWEPGYQIYRSGPVAALADLRAAGLYTRTESEAGKCIRCDVPSEADEILSGTTIALRFPAGLRQLLSPIYGSERLDSAEIDLASVRWETSPSLRQEPTLNPSYGTGDVVPGTLLHSGEMSMSSTDLYLKGRGIDFAFTRTYRNQTVGHGPLGPGCDHSYNRRLRELPNGHVEYYDGRGRRELFAKTGENENGEIVYSAPAGRFWDLKRTGAGWVLVDERRNLSRFDGFGRLTSIADFVKDSEETGNEMRFYYDLYSRLVRVRDTLDRDILFGYDEVGQLTKISDFDGRDVSYNYDGHGRLVTVTSPQITTGLAQFPDGLVTSYGFAENLPDTDLAAYLSQRDNLESVTDPKSQQWLTLLFDDQDGDGRAEEATAQEWGDGAAGISYDFDSRTATVTDRRDNPWVYTHNPAGQAIQMVDPSTATFGVEYDEEGLEIRSVSPLGRVSRTSYADTFDRRSRGNPTKTEVTADDRGANGSDPTLVTTIEYEHRTNQPVRIVDPRGIVTKIERDALGLPETVARAVDEPEGSITKYEYNDFGQIEKVTNPNNHIVTYEYFATGPSTGYLERQLVDPDSLKIETRYETDARGNVTAVIDPRAVKHESQWNEVDWLVVEKRATTASADGAPGLSYETLFLYDANGNLAELRRPFGDTGEEITRERYEYGALDEMLVTRREVEVNQPEPDWVVQTRKYDPNLNLMLLTEPEQEKTLYVYDKRNLLESVTSGFETADAVTESYLYDPEGQQIELTDGREHIWKNEYDGFARTKAQSDPIENQSTTTYDNSGNPLEQRAYEGGLGRLLAQMSYEYDKLDRRIKATQKLWRYQEGGIGLPPTGVRDLVTKTEYDPVSNVTKSIDVLQRPTLYEYDNAERLTQVTDPEGNRVQRVLDPSSNVTEVHIFEQQPDFLGGGEVEVVDSQSYDALGRLLSSTDAL
ncbi:MAG: DUF6531 domain-containing protein, partial [Thermoanaerobaculia bacterium]